LGGGEFDEIGSV